MADVNRIPAVGLPGDVAMPLLGLGTAGLQGERGYEAVRAALDIGYRHLDTATAYGNEAEVGRAVRDSGLARGEVFVTTKLPPERAGHERETLEASLAALGLEYVDLWLVHWPPGGAMPGIWRELLGLRRAGLARAVGVSNYDLAQIDELIAETGQAPAVNQIPWSPSGHDARRLAGHRERAVALEGYSPLKGTDLHDPVLVEIAARHGVTPAQVVLRWHIERGIAVIPKSARRERIAANFDLFGFTPTEDDLDRIDRLSPASG